MVKSTVAACSYHVCYALLVRGNLKVYIRTQDGRTLSLGKLYVNKGYVISWMIKHNLMQSIHLRHLSVSPILSKEACVWEILFIESIPMVIFTFTIVLA